MYFNFTLLGQNERKLNKLTDSEIISGTCRRSD